ncbi:hypothetical protein [Prevotella intermedia]|uniref:hypothetical protein n=1 Tax=Prevotella intermedia TaxID=28131 RepID=UPI0020A35829|nr:hypothetical protein [Prevotella intermedia]
MCNCFVINVLQNLLFCVPKAAVLHGKSVGFASQKSRFRNVKAQLSVFNRIIFTKLKCFPAFSNPFLREFGLRMSF